MSGKVDKKVDKKCTSPIDMLDFSLDEMKEFLAGLGQEKFRARQVMAWLYRGIKDIDDMTDISKELRKKLKEVACIGSIELNGKISFCS